MFSAQALASSINCNLVEFHQGQQHSIDFSIDSSNDPHGGFYFYKGHFFPELSGFVNLSANNGKVFAVVSFYNENLKTNSSAQYELVNDGQYIQNQIIIPIEAAQLSGLQLVCLYQTSK